MIQAESSFGQEGRPAAHPDPWGSEACLELELPEETALRLVAAVRLSRDRLVREVEAERPEEREGGATVPPSLAAARRFVLRGEAVPDWVGLLAMLERFQRIWGVGADYLTGSCAVSGGKR